MPRLLDISLSICVVVVGLQAGCGTVNTTSTRQTPAENEVSSRTQVNDLFSQIFLRARNVRLFPAPSGNMQAQIDVANDGFTTQSFAYQFQWLDASGNIVPYGTTTWQRKSVPAGGSTSISSVAPVPQAVDFSLQLRRDP